MPVCSGCGVEFDESVDLYPRLVITQEVKVARKLAEKEDEEDMLCLGCWLDAADDLDKRQMATLLLGMLRKINRLEEELSKRWKYPSSDGVIEKIREWTPPQPPQNPIWISPHSGGYEQPYVGDPPPEQRPYSTSSARSSAQNYKACNDPKGTRSFLFGTWSDKVQ